MSVRYSHSGGNDLPTSDNDENAPYPTQPTFTARTDGPVPSQAPAPDLGPDDGSYAGAETAGPADVTGGPAEPVPAAADQSRQAQVQSKPSTASPAAALNQPLLSDASGLRQQWQQVQAEFVDDPQEAVGHAADLIEQTTQTLVDTLRQRQQDLRAGWDDSDGAGTATGRVAADTERLRQLMRSYRALFDQLTRP